MSSSLNLKKMDENENWMKEQKNHETIYVFCGLTDRQNIQRIIDLMKIQKKIEVLLKSVEK